MIFIVYKKLRACYCRIKQYTADRQTSKSYLVIQWTFQTPSWSSLVCPSRSETTISGSPSGTCRRRQTGQRRDDWSPARKHPAQSAPVDVTTLFNVVWRSPACHADSLMTSVALHWKPSTIKAGVRRRFIDRQQHEISNDRRVALSLLMFLLIVNVFL